MSDSRPMPLDHERRDPTALVTREDLGHVQRQLAAGGDRMTAIERDIKANTELTAEVKDLLNAAKLGLKVLGWIGVFAVWVGKIATAAITLWGLFQLIRHGAPTPPK